MVTNAKKQTLWHWEGDAFGDVQPQVEHVKKTKRWESDAFGDVQPKIEHVKMPLRMAGQYADDEVGLFYNYFRFYNPETGRYIENAPIDLQGGLNRYGYVGGSPLHYVDPYGLEKFTCRATQMHSNDEIGKKECTYTCTGKCTGTVTIRSNSSIKVYGSQYCRGAEVGTVPGGKGIVGGSARSYHDFNIDTDSWFWDSWGGTEDIYQKLKVKSKEKQCCD